MNYTYKETKKIFSPDKQYPVPVFTAVSKEGYIEINWNKITEEELSGYKIVLSPEQSFAVLSDGWLSDFYNRHESDLL